MKSKPYYKIYTDGSCLGNPGPGGFAVTILNNKDEMIHNLVGGARQTTNNRMEMLAILKALQWLYTNHPSTLPKTEIHTDSNLIVQTLNSGWKKKANTDLWAKIDAFLPNPAIEIFWVKAHANNKWNNLTDSLARRQAQKAAKSTLKKP